MFKKINRLAIKLFSGCNMNCSYCFQQYTEKYQPKTFQDFNNLYNFLKTLSYEDKVIVTFCGGEMTLRPNLIEECEKKVFKKIEREIDVCFEYGMITNGTNIETMLDLFDRKVLNPEYCNFSWDGLFSSSLSRHINGQYNDEYFQNVIKKIGQSNYNKIFSIVHALTPSTVPYLAKSFQFCIENNAYNFGYYPIHEANYSEEFHKLFEIELNKIFELLVQYKNEPINFFNLETIKQKQNKTLYFTCTKLGHNYYINPLGDIYPCIYFGDNKSFKLGNIYNGINYDLVEDFIEKYLHYPDCDYQNCKCTFCGECPAACYVNNGNMNKKFKNLCEIRKIEKNIYEKFENKLDGSYILLKNYSNNEDIIKNTTDLVFKDCEMSKLVNEIHPPHIEIIRNWK